MGRGVRRRGIQVVEGEGFASRGWGGLGKERREREKVSFFLVSG